MNEKYNNNNQIEALVLNRKFYNEKNNYYVLQVKIGKKGNSILCGYGTNIKQNDCIIAQGEWISNKHGTQFYANLISPVKPSKKDTILEYLSSGIVKGISKKNAEDMVRMWGENAINILDEHPEQLLLLGGIGQKKLQKIINSWDEVRPSEQTVSELMSMGFQNFEAIKIFKRFGSESLSIVRTNPYMIHRRVSNVDFEKVDAVALEIGFLKDNPDRIVAAIEYFLRELHKNGDTIIEYGIVLETTAKYLDVEIDIVDNIIQQGIEKFFFYEKNYNNKKYLQLRSVKTAQDDIARRLYCIINNSDHKPKKDAVFELVDIVRKGEKKISFSDEQKNAIIKSINSKISIITGKPGAGKTTVLNEVIKQLNYLNKSILMCAPTGKAAQKMFESTGLPSSTIHRLLEFNPLMNDYQRNESNPLECDVLVMDESSMIDIFLMANLLKAVSDSTMIVIIGDVNQLPSVGCGAVLRDLINSDKIPVSRLETIFRQKGTSQIVLKAHEIDVGKFDFEEKYNKNKLTDFYFLPTHTDEESLIKIKTITERLQSSFNIDPMGGLQILSPLHKGTLGSQNLNTYMQGLLNYENRNELERPTFKFKEKDRVIQIINNYDKNVFNGDCGIIEHITLNGIIVKFDNGMEVEYNPSELNELLLSYSMTVHKSQGSEYPAIIVVIPQTYSGLIDRSLIYTAITRGKQLAIFIGSQESLRRGIESVKSRNRSTDLREKILEYFETSEEEEAFY